MEGQSSSKLRANKDVSIYASLSNLNCFIFIFNASAKEKRITTN